MPQLPLSPGPPVGLIYCLCFLAYFNEDVLFLEGTATVQTEKKLSLRVQHGVRRVGFLKKCHLCESLNDKQKVCTSL